MPIPGTTTDTALERERLWARLNRDDLAAAEAENDRLRDLLVIARNSLAQAQRALPQSFQIQEGLAEALRHSDPDAQPEHV